MLSAQLLLLIKISLTDGEIIPNKISIIPFLLVKNKKLNQNTFTTIEKILKRIDI